MRPRRPKRDAPVSVGGAISRVLEELGHAGASQSLKIAAGWEEAVGSEVAAHCQPVALRGGVLEAVVDSSVWRQHLEMRRAELLQALRDALGADAPADLRLRVG